MSGSDFIFNIAKGRWGYYATLPAANDKLVAVALVASGLEADGTLKDYDDLSALLAAANDECTASGYSRVQLTTVTSPPDDTNDWQVADCDDFSFGSIASGGSALAKTVVCYNPDTTVNGALGVGHESALIPLWCWSFDVTPDGTLVTAVVSGSGLAKAA